VAGDIAVRAGWALWGKEPGSRADYSVLACSPEPFSRGDFGTIITRFAAGTPDTRAVGPGELPWVTVSWVGVDASLHLGMAITDKTDQVDGVGRPITQTSYFCVPYRDLAAAGLSYSALYDAVARVRLRPENGGPVALSVAVTTAEEAARRVEDIGDRIVSAAAALLLRGPVSVVEADGSTLRQRLEFVDAVASLLPYGLRGRFSAATWSDSGTRHRLRLAFASRPRDDATAVPWQHPGEVPEGDDVARAYFEQLRKLRSGSTAHGKKFDVSTVVAHLAARAEPQKFEHPQEALAILRETDLPDRVLRAVRDGAAADLAELRQVTRPGPAGQMLPDERDDLYTALSGMGSAEDWPALSPWLGQLHNHDTLCRALAQFGQRVLWTAEPDDDVLSECLAMAAERGIDDDVLARLVLPADQAVNLPGSVRNAASLLAGRVLVGGSSGMAYLATREALAKAPLTVTEYLAALASSHGAAAPLLGWLGSSVPPEVTRPFRIALGAADGDIAERDIARLADLGIGCVRALLATGSDGRRLNQMLPGFVSWLASRGELEPSERRYWSQHLRGLSPDTPGLRACLDTALLTIGTAPTALPPQAGTPDSATYVTTMVAIYKRLTRDYSLFSAERCVRALARYLERQEWAPRKAQAAAVTDLTGQLLGYDREHVLAGVVGSALAAIPAAKRWDFAQDWLARVRENDPEAIRSGLLSALQTAEPGTEPGQLAGLCVRAHREGVTADQAYRKLARSGVLDSAQAAAGTLDALRREWTRSAADPVQGVEWQVLLVRRLVLGAFGEAVGRDFRELMSRNLRWSIRVQIALLDGLVEGERDGHYEITDQEREDLAQFTDALEVIQKKSRKGVSLWRRAGNAVPQAQES
jgi:hypothetical protein